MSFARAWTAASLITVAALLPLGRTVAVALASHGNAGRPSGAEDEGVAGSCPERAQRRAETQCPDSARESGSVSLHAATPGSTGTPAPLAESNARAGKPSPLDPMVSLDAAIAALALTPRVTGDGSANWPTLHAEAANRIADGSDLFDVLSSLLASGGPEIGAWLHASDGRVWAADRRVSPAESRQLTRLAALIDSRYAATDAAAHAGGSVVTARLRDGTLYIRPRSPQAASDSEGSLVPERDAATAVLDALVSSLDDREPVVIDLRFPAAACLWDPIAFARRITQERILAFRVVDASAGSPAAPVHLDPSDSPRVTGPVVLLTGPLTSSGGETLALVTMRMPGVTRVGQPTSGTCAAMLKHPLPNGWTLALPGARLLTWDFAPLDGGIAPHIVVDAVESPSAESDAGIEAALEYLDRLRRSGLIRGGRG